jgi:hypothetical protein
LAERFSGFAQKLTPGSYYYGGVPTHPGNLCKSLIETVALSRHNNSEFLLASIPTLLSVWSGKRCPVYYGDSINDLKMNDVFDYVSDLSKMQWEYGAKYFYGEKIE